MFEACAPACRQAGLPVPPLALELIHELRNYLTSETGFEEFLKILMRKMNQSNCLY